MNLNFQDHFYDWVKHRTALCKVYDYRSPVIHENRKYKVHDPRSGKTVVMLGITKLIDKYIVTKKPLPFDINGYPAPHGRGKGRSRIKKLSKGSTFYKKPCISARTIEIPGLGAINVVTPNGRPRKSLPLVLQLRGAERGSFVHRQIEELVYSESLDAMMRRPANHIGIHYFAPLLLLHVVSMNIRPLICEFRVYDEAIGCGTKIDEIGVASDGKIWAFENKTGYSKGRFTRVTKERWLIPELAERAAQFPCTVRNKAVVQVVLGAAMLMRLLGIPENMIRTAVLRVDEGGVDQTIISPEFFHDLVLILYKYLVPLAAQVRAAAIKEEEEEGEDATPRDSRKKTKNKH